MKLLDQELISNQPGTITIIPETPDDLSLLSNLIVNGDVVSAETTRKIQNNSGSASKKSNSRIKLELEIRVISLDYDKNCSILRVRGKTITSNDPVKSGTFHTMELETKKEFKLMKEIWEDEAIRVLNDGSGKKNRSKHDICLILMDQVSAEILLISKTDAKAKTTLATIIKGKNTSKKFFENLYLSFIKYVNMYVLSHVLIASNEAIKDEFRVYLLLEAHKSKVKSIDKSRIFMVNKSNVKDILRDKEIMSMTNNMKSEMDMKVLEKFMNEVLTDNNRACYGTKSVEYAHASRAIETLLIIEEVSKNEELVRLKKSVSDAGGKVIQFKHSEGSQMTGVAAEGFRIVQTTGVAAILRFPIMVL